MVIIFFIAGYYIHFYTEKVLAVFYYQQQNGERVPNAQTYARLTKIYLFR